MILASGGQRLNHVGKFHGGISPTGYPRAVKYQELEETLCRIPTVDAARVVATNGTILEVHVLASVGKAPKQVVRDVQSLAMAAFGITIDRRVISVVQIENDELGRSDRPAIVDIVSKTEGAKVGVEVTLAWQNELLVGVASGPAGPTSRPRLVGEAALSAIGQAIGDDAAIALAALETPTIGAREVAIAQVVLVNGGEERLVVGSALIGPDADQAIVRAVLDAINRQVPQLKR